MQVARPLLVSVSYFTTYTFNQKRSLRSVGGQETWGWDSVPECLKQCLGGLTFQAGRRTLQFAKPQTIEPGPEHKSPASYLLLVPYSFSAAAGPPSPIPRPHFTEHRLVHPSSIVPLSPSLCSSLTPLTPVPRIFLIVRKSCPPRHPKHMQTLSQ